MVYPQKKLTLALHFPEYSCFFSFLGCSVVSNACKPMDHSLPVSSVHGISQARILVWVAISSSGGSSWPRDHSCLRISFIAGGFFTAQQQSQLQLTQNLLYYVIPVFLACSRTIRPSVINGMQLFPIPVLALFLQCLNLAIPSVKVGMCKRTFFSL